MLLMIGVWRRDILERPDRPPDRSTLVYWLQGPRFFIDLRQPAHSPDFNDTRCLSDLTLDHLPWLATQEGFAGCFHLEEGIALWEHHIDFQPAGSLRDRARLSLNDNALHEEGTEQPYYERWTREGAHDSSALGMRLACASRATCGYLVRVGNRFMFARDRASPLPEGTCLTALMDGELILEQKRDLVDLEISLGDIDASGAWTIRRSTLPFKVGDAFLLERTAADTLEIRDMERDGGRFLRRWRILELDRNEERQ
jgi:hypothetical protein